MRETKTLAFTREEFVKNASVIVRPLSVEHNGISKSYKDWVNKWLVIKKDNGVAFVTREILKAFDLDEETLWKLAEVHAKEDFEIFDFMGDGNMFVGTNKDRVEGACNALLNVDEAFKALNTKKVWVIPSSIHEVLFIADREGVTEEGLSELICSVNKSDCKPEEVLATTPLYFEI